MMKQTGKQIAKYTRIILSLTLAIAKFAIVAGIITYPGLKMIVSPKLIGFLGYEYQIVY